MPHFHLRNINRFGAIVSQVNGTVLHPKAFKDLVLLQSQDQEVVRTWVQIGDQVLDVAWDIGNRPPIHTTHLSSENIYFR